ncbi:cathelicidin antimicrobial peptide isoform X2 [Pongo abelii]|uniref:cathelicidin antimicrobial peptide isoform X2 n=1 Tax=Pongo abelii TaxID=9601 RepID=UPI0023E7F567|nr:cathelicidin antimicrobial peptide isoform X2 [Pongo abelii]
MAGHVPRTHLETLAQVSPHSRPQNLHPETERTGVFRRWPLKPSVTSDGEEDGDPDTPKPVSFTVKETVCPRRTQQSPEDCDFKKDGLVKRCVGTVTLNQARGSFDISCDKDNRRFALLGDFFREAREKIGEEFKRIVQRIKDFLRNLVPRTES